MKKFAMSAGVLAALCVYSGAAEAGANTGFLDQVDIVLVPIAGSVQRDCAGIAWMPSALDARFNRDIGVKQSSGNTQMGKSRTAFAKYSAACENWALGKQNNATITALSQARDDAAKQYLQLRDAMTKSVVELNGFSQMSKQLLQVEKDPIMKNSLQNCATSTNQAGQKIAGLIKQYTSGSPDSVAAKMGLDCK